MDGLSIEMVPKSEHGESGFLGEIEQSLKDRAYRPQALKRVYIPKTNGKQRPLGNPPVRFEEGELIGNRAYQFSTLPNAAA